MRIVYTAPDGEEIMATLVDKAITISIGRESRRFMVPPVLLGPVRKTMRARDYKQFDQLMNLLSEPKPWMFEGEYKHEPTLQLS